MTVDLLSRVAGAPISWGICEVPGWGLQLPYNRVFSEAAELGLSAMEQGALGWLPSDPGEQRAIFDRYGMELHRRVRPAGAARSVPPGRDAQRGDPDR